MTLRDWLTLDDHGGGGAGEEDTDWLVNTKAFSFLTQLLSRLLPLLLPRMSSQLMITAEGRIW